MIILQLIFWLLTSISIFPAVPMKYSLTAFFVLVHIDLSGSSALSATNVGIENAFVTLFIPTILLLRGYPRLKQIFRVMVKPAFITWILFIVYIAIATYWSPFKLSAFKQIGYLLSYTIIFLLIYRLSINHRKLVRNALVWSFYGSLVIGVFRELSGLASISTFSEAARFSSFTAPQNYGLFLALNLAVILALYSENKFKFTPTTLIVTILSILAVIINGSRTALLLILIFFLAIYIWNFFNMRTYITAITVTLLPLLAITAVGLMVLRPDLISSLPGVRSLELINILTNRSQIEDIGTARFRLNMYETAIEEYSNATNSRKILGLGTASGGEIVTEGLVYYRGYTDVNIDANRIIHNDYLRVVYEWGIIGVVLFFTFLLLILFRVLQLYISYYSLRIYLLAISLFLFLGIMAVNNILPAGGNPTGVIISIIFAQIALPNYTWSKVTSKHRNTTPTIQTDKVMA